MGIEKKTVRKAFIPILLIFILLNAAIFSLRSWFASKGIDQMVLLWGNVLLFAVTTLSFVFYSKAMAHQHTQGFLRYVYSGMMIKLFACIIGAFIYIYAAGAAVNTAALFGCMGLYLLYTFFEMRGVLQFNRQQKNDA